jgi:hypothetical protein
MPTITKVMTAITYGSPRQFTRRHVYRGSRAPGPAFPFSGGDPPIRLWGFDYGRTACDHDQSQRGQRQRSVTGDRSTTVTPSGH